MQFKDIVGQEETKRQLRAAVREGRIPHAQLLSGPEGSGKLPLALAYAQYLACPHRTEEDSCGVCPTCLQYAKLQHPDLHFAYPIVKGDAGDVCDDFAAQWRKQVLSQPYFDLTDWYRTLGVDNKQALIYEKESGEILRKLSLKSFADGFKVMIIWQADKMNESCANKILKLVEEPPEQTLFLLITEHPENMLSTIVSRTQPILLNRLSDSEVMAGAQVSEDIAHIAGGNMVKALRIGADSEEMHLQFEDFIALMRNAYTVGQIKDAQKKFDSLQALRKWSAMMAESKVGRERQKAFLQYAQRQIRENYIRRYNQPSINYQTGEESAFSDRFAAFIHDGNVEAIMEELERAEVQISQNGNAKIIFFDMCLQMIVRIKK